MVKIRAALFLFCTLVVASCVWIVETGSVDEVETDNPLPQAITAPMKVFLQNGDMVLYTEGAQVWQDRIRGRGARYTLDRRRSAMVEDLPLDSIIGIEAFRSDVNDLASAALTIGATAVTAVGGVAIFKALFGSCPTFYASSENGGALQAEGFSYSIAPQAEGIDLDRLYVTPDADGVLRLEVRNEALETHYINQVELVAVEHAPGVHVVPDAEGQPLGTSVPAAPVQAVDRDGRLVLAEIVAEDDLAFASTESRIRAATTEDSRDYLDLVFPRPDGDEAVLVLNLRNSLLNTVLYYDLMLGTTGVQAVNWWGGSLEGIGAAIDMARWYAETLGLTVQVPSGDSWQDVTRMSGTGPIAWKEIGVRVPMPQEGPVRVRLSFLADDWRLDQVSLAAPAEPLTAKRIPLHRVVTGIGEGDQDAATRLARPDDQYFVTYPGTSATLEFLTEGPEAGMTATYLLATQGYYIEWVRPEWIRRAQTTAPFQSGPGSVESLMALWLDKKDTLEDEFFGSKIPVR
jgi:hypothetical protein